MEGNNDQQQHDHNNSVASFRTVHRNLAPVRHSTKFPGNTTAKNLPTNNDFPESYKIEQIENIYPEDSASHVLKTSTILCHILTELKKLMSKDCIWEISKSKKHDFYCIIHHSQIIKQTWDLKLKKAQLKKLPNQATSITKHIRCQIAHCDRMKLYITNDTPRKKDEILKIMIITHTNITMMTIRTQAHQGDRHIHQCNRQVMNLQAQFIEVQGRMANTLH